MPTQRIPLVGSFNQRTIAGTAQLTAERDQRFLNCTFNVVRNPVTSGSTVYVEKRPGWAVDSIVASGNPSTGLLKTAFLGSSVSAFGATNSTVYDGQNSVGTITGRAIHFNESLVSGTGYVLIKSSDGTGWYYPADSRTQTTYSGNISSGSAVITNIASTAGMYSGQALSANGVPAGTRILTVDSSSQITLNANAVSSSAASVLTKTPIAKILDSDFSASTTYHSALVPMDGYHFYSTDDGKVRNSDLNSVTAYTAANFISPNASPDPPVALATHGSYLVSWGTGSRELFYNAGNSTGSPLSRVAGAASRLGAVDQRGVVVLGDVIYYVGGARFGDVQVMRLRGVTDDVISTPEISKILGTITASGGQIYASAFQLGGHSYLALTALTSSEAVDLMLLEAGDYLLLENGDNLILEGTGAESSAFGRMLVYDVNLNLWTEWDSDEATYIVGVGAGSVNQVLATSRVSTGGKVYSIKPASDGETHTDDGSTYSMQIRTSRINFGTDRRKFIKSIRLIADDQDDGDVTLEYSDDDYETWHTLGTFDLTRHEKRINRCGAHKGGRAYRLTHSDDGPFRAEALEIEYDEAVT